MGIQVTFIGKPSVTVFPSTFERVQHGVVYTQMLVKMASMVKGTMAADPSTLEFLQRSDTQFVS